MATGIRYTSPVAFYQDTNGAPLACCTLTFYENGTTTPKAVYSDINLQNPITDPVVSNAAGYFINPDIFLDSDPYRVVLKDCDGQVVFDKNDVNVIEPVFTEGQFYKGDTCFFYRDNGDPAPYDAKLASGWTLADGNPGPLGSITPNLIVNSNTGYNFIRATDSFAAVGLEGGQISLTPTGTVEDHTLTIAEMPSHTHPIAKGPSDTGGGALADGEPGGSPRQTESTGGDQPHNHGLTLETITEDEFMPPNVSLLLLIYGF